MGYYFAVKHGLEVEICNHKIKTADVIIKEVIRKTQLLLVDVKGNPCMLDFLIIKYEDHDILLGLDSFSLTNAGIYPSLNTIRFPDERENEDVEMASQPTRRSK